jgi:hypothetical protein
MALCVRAALTKDNRGAALGIPIAPTFTSDRANRVQHA